MDRYVVLIDAGGKQDFIFASNKQAANIGASDLIRILGEEWVPDAIAKVAAELAPDAVTKRWERAPQQLPPQSSPDVTARLERIEHAVEAVAIEVERIAEAQRFSAKLMADQARSLPRSDTTS